MRKDEIKVGDVLVRYTGPRPRDMSPLDAAVEHGGLRAVVMEEPAFHRRDGWGVKVAVGRPDMDPVTMTVPTRDLVGQWADYERLHEAHCAWLVRRAKEQAEEREALEARWAALTPRLEAKGVRFVIPPTTTVVALSIEQIERLVADGQ